MDRAIPAIPDGYISLRLETFKWRRRRTVETSHFKLVDTIELGCPAWGDVARLIAEVFDTAAYCGPLTLKNGGARPAAPI